jgi:hypothetical protein
LAEESKIMGQVTKTVDWVRRIARVLIATLASDNGAHIRRVIERHFADAVRDLPERVPKLNSRRRLPRTKLPLAKSPPELRPQAPSTHTKPNGANTGSSMPRPEASVSSEVGMRSILRITPQISDAPMR